MNLHINYICIYCDFFYRSGSPKVFLEKDVLKICNKFTGEHPCRNAISIKLPSNFIVIALWHGCSALNLLYIFRKPFARNTSGRLLLNILVSSPDKALFRDVIQKSNIGLEEFLDFWGPILKTSVSLVPDIMI